MFTVNYGAITENVTPYDTQSVTEFLINGDESGEAFEGTMKFGSAHDMQDIDHVNRSILAALAYDTTILEQADEKSLRGLVQHMVDEFQSDVKDAFDAAEQLIKMDAWLSRLTTNERSHLASFLED